jgi:hypothetical protein
MCQRSLYVHFLAAMECPMPTLVTFLQKACFPKIKNPIFKIIYRATKPQFPPSFLAHLRHCELIYNVVVACDWKLDSFVPILFENWELRRLIDVIVR